MQFYNDAQRRIQVKKIKASDFSLKVIESALELAFVVEDVSKASAAQDDITFQWVVLVILRGPQGKTRLEIERDIVFTLESYLVSYDRYTALGKLIGLRFENSRSSSSMLGI